MKPTILITGAGGLVANRLKEMLGRDYNLNFLTRNPKAKNEYLWDIERGFLDEKALGGVEHILHLAGASVGEKSWTEVRRREILTSRIGGAKLLLDKIKEKNLRLKSYISASAVGYYGTMTSDEILTEESPIGNDFLSEVCRKWEQSAVDFQEVSERVVRLRLGVVLSKKGGALPQMIRPTRYYANAVLGTGKQIVTWIDIDDLAEMIRFCLKRETMDGVYNAVSPNPVSNAVFTHTLAKIMNRKIIFPPIPKWFVKLLFGEASVLLLEGSRVSCEKILAEGFTFRYGSLEASLRKEIERK